MGNFKDEFDATQKENAMNGDFFKFKRDGSYKFRIMCEPVKKVSRFGYGICYEGAPFCQKAQLEADYKKKVEEATKEGKDPKKVSQPNLSIKWMTWAYLYDKDEKAKKFLETGSFVIFNMSNPIATAIRELMESDEYSFKEFPMPYDITVNVKDAGKTTVEYQVLPARNNTEVSESILEEYAKLTPVQQIKEKLQNKQKNKDEGNLSDGSPVDYPEEEAGEIPF